MNTAERPVNALDRRTAIKWLALGAVSLNFAKGAPAGGNVNNTREKEFDDWIQAEMLKARVPGMSVAVVEAGETVFSKGFGWANVQARTRVNSDTIFHIASVSKLVTCTALMMLKEKGEFQLDDSIAKFVDFPVVHPKYSDVPITFRQLLTHTAGISDQNYDAGSFTELGDSKIQLREFLVNYLSAGGRWYTEEGSFGSARPGEQFKYSNVAMALVGYLVGRVGKLPLDSFTQTEIFSPLGMNNSSWHLRDVRCPERLAAPHNLSNSGWTVFDPIGYPDWPAGLLRTSALDLALFLGIFANRGKEGSKAQRIKIKESTVNEMLERQSVSDHYQALAWIGSDNKGKLRLGHSGGDPGANTAVAMNSERTRAVVVLMNVGYSSDVNAFTHEVIDRLFDFV